MLLLNAISTSATPSPNTITSNTPFLPLAPADIVFRDWCDDAGILVNKSVSVVTSSQSVAGRGLFALDDLDEGDPVAMIPSHVIFSPENAAAYFPHTAETIRENKMKLGMDVGKSINNRGNKKKRFFGLLSGLTFVRNAWKNARKRRHHRRVAADISLQFADLDDLWQPELTQYASAVGDANINKNADSADLDLDAASDDCHPWYTWMEQWRRDDPTYTLFQNQIKLSNENEIRNAAHDLQKIMPFLSHDWLVAALSIRLGRWEEHQRLFHLDDDVETAKMYALIGSRTATLYNNQIGIVPFHDMINHSMKPNLTMLNDEEGVKLFANRKIGKGEELFLSYTKLNEEMDEANALWPLVQWGIPTPREDIVGPVGSEQV